MDNKKQNNEGLILITLNKEVDFLKNTYNRN